MEKSCVDRINELAKIAKQRELTEEEAKERHELRQKYLSDFRASFRAQLDNTYIQRENGEREKLKKKDS